MNEISVSTGALSWFLESLIFGFQNRLDKALEDLGSQSASTRMGAVQALIHLVREYKNLNRVVMWILLRLGKDYRNLDQRVMNILCFHIRQTTRSNEYRKKYKVHPSTEIQEILTLLFVDDHDIFEGCFINLKGSYLVGADLMDVTKMKTITHPPRRARLKGVNLQNAQLQDANLTYANLQYANLWKAQMQYAVLHFALMEGAMIDYANLQNATMLDTDLQFADLEHAKMQGSIMDGTQLQGAKLKNADWRGALAIGVQMQGAKLEGLQLQGVGRSRDERYPPFENLIKDRIGKESDLSGITFSGMLGNKFAKERDGLTDWHAKELHRIYNQHVRRPASNELPANSGAVTTPPYTKDQADQWIEEYKKATLQTVGKLVPRKT